MPNTVRHTHTVDCLGVNELSELCCGVDDTHLQECERYTVTLADGAIELVFSHSDEDAMAIARADGKAPISAAPVPDPYA